MNRRSFFAAIPAAVAALAGARATAATQPTTVVVSSYTHAANTYILPRVEEAITAVQLPAMVPGTLYCPHCDANVFLHGRKLNDDHLIADRDGYRDTGRVLLDGVDVGDRCVEAMVGDHGWVLLDAWDPADRYEALCRNCCQPMQKLLRGHVVYWLEAI